MLRRPQDQDQGAESGFGTPCLPGAAACGKLIVTTCAPTDIVRSLTCVQAVLALLHWPGAGAGSGSGVPSDKVCHAGLLGMRPCCIRDVACQSCPRKSLADFFFFSLSRCVHVCRSMCQSPPKCVGLGAGERYFAVDSGPVYFSKVPRKMPV